MGVLTIEHLTKKIGNKTILEDVSFKLKRGQIVGLVGANGAGKTTLMKVILGYSSFQSGNFNVINSKDSKSNIGALIENPGIYPFMSGYENLKLLNESKNTQDIDKIVSQLHMDEYIHKKAKTYSLGMKQKLGIAIAFLNEPQFIILDEPMNGLDPKAVRDVRELIVQKSQEGVTFLISSHILSELVKITNSILIINKGKIVTETSEEELKQFKDNDLENVLLEIIERRTKHKMGTLIKQECFKLFKKKSTFIAPIVFILLMVAQGYIATKYNEIFTPQESFTSAYNGFSWFAFLLIIQASTIISMEFHYGTIKNLLYREYSRTTMIVSKIITLFIISLIYFVITIIASIVIGSLFFNDLNIFESSGNQLSLLNQLLLVSLGTFVGVWLVLSLTLLLSSATNSTGVAIAVGIVFYFASSILAVIQTALLEKIDWLKWNPINMMNIMLQTVEKGFSKSTKLELHELFIGNIAYISIFLILVVFIFKKKNI